MKKIKRWAALLAAWSLIFLSGCGIDFGVFSSNGRDDNDTEVQKPLENDEEEFVYTGTDSIFYDNTQTAYSFVSSADYLSIAHAVFQAETLRSPKGYVLRIRNGRTDEETGDLVGFLHWQELEFNALRTCFSDKSLYTFAQNGEVPKLDDKGPLGLLFEDGVLDCGNLNIIFTDLMENEFGGSQIAAELSKVLTQRDGVEAVLYGFSCDGFSGNMSFPSYTTNGSSVKTVEGYRGSAAFYILAIGPVSEVEGFCQRFETQLDGSIKVNKALYVNDEKYPSYTGLSEFRAVQSLDRKISGGNAETLNYTVNAENLGGMDFEYSSSHTSFGHKDSVQLSLISDISEDSPFIEGGLYIEGFEVTPLDKKAGEEKLDAELYIEVLEHLDAWKEGAERSEALNKISKTPVVSVMLSISDMPKGRYQIEFDIMAEVASSDWIDGFSAGIYEFQSLSGLLEPGSAANRLKWKAGATDILSKTLDLADIDRLLGGSVTRDKIVEHITITIER